MLLHSPSAGYGVVAGGHLPDVDRLASRMRATRVANALGFRIAAMALAGQQQITREEILDHRRRHRPRPRCCSSTSTRRARG